jgi:hypothetical protein
VEGGGKNEESQEVSNSGSWLHHLSGFFILQRQAQSYRTPPAMSSDLEVPAKVLGCTGSWDPWSWPGRQISRPSHVPEVSSSTGASASPQSLSPSAKCTLETSSSLSSLPAILQSMHTTPAFIHTSQALTHRKLPRAAAAYYKDRINHSYPHAPTLFVCILIHPYLIQTLNYKLICLPICFSLNCKLL